MRIDVQPSLFQDFLETIEMYRSKYEEAKEYERKYFNLSYGILKFTLDAGSPISFLESDDESKREIDVKRTLDDLIKHSIKQDRISGDEKYISLSEIKHDLRTPNRYERKFVKKFLKYLLTDQEEPNQDT